MTQPVHKDRRNAGDQPLEFTLTEDALIWRTEDGEWGGDMPFDTVREVRLTVETAGGGSQVVCRVTDMAGREAVFGSMRWIGAGRWESAADTFQILLRGLHASLLPHAQTIRFVEGRSVAFRTAIFLSGAILTAIGAIFFVLLFLMRENPFGLLLVAPVAAGIWLMRLCWPRAPAPYDPQAYAEPPAPLDGD